MSEMSGTFKYIVKVLFTFPSWYLFAIGLERLNTSDASEIARRAS